MNARSPSLLPQRHSLYTTGSAHGEDDLATRAVRVETLPDQAFAHLGVLPIDREPTMHSTMMNMVSKLDETEAIEQVCEAVTALEGREFKNRDLAS